MEYKEHIKKPSDTEVEEVVKLMMLSFGKILKTKEAWLQSLWTQLFAVLKGGKRSAESENIYRIASLLTDPEMIGETIAEINTTSTECPVSREILKSTAYWIFRELKSLEDTIPRIQWTNEILESSDNKFSRTPHYKEELQKMKNFLVGDNGIFRTQEDLTRKINKKYQGIFSRTPASLSWILKETKYTMTPITASAIYFLIEQDTENWEQNAHIFCDHLIKIYGENALEKMDNEKYLLW